MADLFGETTGQTSGAERIFAISMVSLVSCPRNSVPSGRKSRTSV